MIKRWISFFRNGAGSTLTPGLMVAASVMASTNEPLAVAGRAFDNRLDDRPAVLSQSLLAK